VESSALTNDDTDVALTGDLAVNGGDITSIGALTVTPNAGNNLNIALSTTGDFIVNTDDLVVNTSAGNVGIGTTTPTSALTVAGGHLQITGNTPPSGGTGVEISHNGTVGTLRSYDRTTSAHKSMKLDGLDHEFAVSANAAVTIDSSGNVGIGTTAPAEKLHVQGAVLREGWIMCRRSSDQTGFTGALTDIDWTAEVREDSNYYTHSGTSDNITVLQTGWYRISYCINFDNRSNDRSCFRVEVYDDGSEIAGSLSSIYSRNSGNSRYVHCSNSFIANITANSVIDVRTKGQGRTGDFDYNVLTQSQITIERIDG
jgi:hypothetical protein